MKKTLKIFAEENGKILKSPKDIINEAKDNIVSRHKYTSEQIKKRFDELIMETEEEAHAIYRHYEEVYGHDVLALFVNSIIERDNIQSFLMPSEAHYKINPMDCIIFTAKRTIRERWRQIVTEGTRGLGFYLATIDDKVSRNQLEEMLNHRIYLVCPEEIRNLHYKNIPNILSFKEFFKDHLDPAMKRWKRKGIINTNS
ncbi:hypothetical protein CO178_01230 [candidate division WWE3 bacterium CG_4_9_14_3_um_filter_34_6]|uniref:Restriction endonuclease type II EcoRII C-terminal domain-containing protein n=1 Tax=candidate division WWE3 bacterium CG_4_9_14_3_um_filter_34_6 TaxID=1975079 RepID=A0A2M7X492_UNCKA|nr:MAG: hypothetical protein CO178_01230 [candidate division WWE3 bacterium CG_4_9_14_3_um_filter_34_6]